MLCDKYMIPSVLEVLKIFSVMFLGVSEAGWRDLLFRISLWSGVCQRSYELYARSQSSWGLLSDDLKPTKARNFRSTWIELSFVLIIFLESASHWGKDRPGSLVSLYQRPQLWSTCGTSLVLQKDQRTGPRIGSEMFLTGIWGTPCELCGLIYGIGILEINGCTLVLRIQCIEK